MFKREMVLIMPNLIFFFLSSIKKVNSLIAVLQEKWLSGRCNFWEPKLPQYLTSKVNPSNLSNLIILIHNLLNPSNNSDSKGINNTYFYVDKI